jgi:nucleoside-diphosphate-sugar epimerase
MTASTTASDLRLEKGSFEHIAVIGGAGYVGSVLVPALLAAGYHVTVFDLFIYGEDSLAPVRSDPNLKLVRGDVRDTAAVAEAIAGCDALIHLACISNDPSVELDPALSESVNFASFGPLVRAAKEAGVRRFIFASSGSVYGVSDSPNVTEDHPLVPVSLYNKYKAMCEPVLFAEQSDAFTTVAVRPATICGYSPRQRLDLTVNILTSHAYHNGRITVFGGSQMRPNLHMHDMIELYGLLLTVPSEKIAGKVFNAGYQNYSVAETADVVRDVVKEEIPDKDAIEIVTTPSDDIRSYRINSDKVRLELGFEPKRTIEDGARDLIRAFASGLLPDAMTDIRYSNIKTMKALQVS